MKKLTLVSISFRGRRISKFVHADVIDGKVIVSQALTDRMLADAGHPARGLTYSIG